jgi:phosphatidylserine/phosphatidylglycerophosphate/cardiolipin synthase-like enzyme
MIISPTGNTAPVISAPIPALENLGFSIRKLTGVPSGLMHNKYMIIDRKFLLSGSYNWSVSAEERNFENAVFIAGTPVVMELKL